MLVGGHEVEQQWATMLGFPGSVAGGGCTFGSVRAHRGGRGRSLAQAYALGERAGSKCWKKRLFWVHRKLADPGMYRRADLNSRMQTCDLMVWVEPNGYISWSWHEPLVFRPATPGGTRSDDRWGGILSHQPSRSGRYMCAVIRLTGVLSSALYLSFFGRSGVHDLVLVGKRACIRLSLVMCGTVGVGPPRIP